MPAHQLLHSSERTRIYRLHTGAGSIICKQPLGPDAYDRLRRERDILARLAGVAGVPELAQADHPSDVIPLRESALAQAAQAIAPDGRPPLLAGVAVHRGELARRAADAPANFRHLLAWLDAELAWAGDDYRRATQAFDDALAALESGRRPWRRALVTERAALFYLAQDMPQLGRRFMADARASYHAWGASAKVHQLERNHPFLQGAQADVAGEMPARAASRRAACT